LKTPCATTDGEIPGDQPKQAIDDYEEKDFAKRKVSRQEWKTP